MIWMTLHTMYMYVHVFVAEIRCIDIDKIYEINIYTYDIMNWKIKGLHPFVVFSYLVV